MIDEASYIAGTRFGLGLSPGDIARIGGNPGSWLMNQIRSPQMTGPGFAALRGSAQTLGYTFHMHQELKLEKASQKHEAKNELRHEFKDQFIEEMRARIGLAVATTTPFYERLVNFWSNHFTVSVKRTEITGIAGAYEREAIRPHVCGRFADMLLAVAHHPAMLLYLDNAKSIGPGTVVGVRKRKGLNENLAREILELHTLGVNGGYTQKDVTTFAKVITGWTIGDVHAGMPGAFVYVERRHEPGTHRILGKDYPDRGEEQGIDVLRDLARKPATATFIATKLARHFIADNPPASAVAALAKVFLDTGGDLPELYRALIGIPEAWDIRTHAKIKNNYDLVVSAARVSDRTDEEAVNYCLKSMKFLGDAPFTANSPAGMPDTIQGIAGPETMIRRVEWAQQASANLKPANAIGALAEAAAGPVLGEATRAALASARNEREAIAILFGSPDFQRR